MHRRTTDTSFVEDPPTSSRVPPKFSTPAPASRHSSAIKRGGGELGTSGRGGATRGTGRGMRGSGLARAKPRGAK